MTNRYSSGEMACRPPDGAGTSARFASFDEALRIATLAILLALFACMQRYTPTLLRIITGRK